LIRKLLFLILCYVSTFCLGQTANDSLQVVPIDANGVLSERSFEDLSKKYQGEEFNYDIKTGESQNLISRFLSWLGHGLDDVFGVRLSPAMLTFLKYLIYALMSGVTIYLIVRMLINEKFSSIFTKKANPITAIDMTEQHIESLDLDALLKEALQKNNYRLAIRYQYLKSLKRLSQTNIIEWHFDKTNSDYEKEIQEPRLKTGFRKISYLYDYIWYGEQAIDAFSYERALESFTTLNGNIRQ